MLVKISTNKTVSEAAAALQAAVQANHFGVMIVKIMKEAANGGSDQSLLSAG